MTRMKRVAVFTIGLMAAGAGLALAQGQGRNQGYRYLLTGTYQLESGRSDDPRRVADLASRDLPPDQRSRMFDSLMTRLESPNVIAIERMDNSVSMASTLARRVTFDADGRDRTERWSADRTMNTRVSLEGERLVVMTSGHRGSAFTATFDPLQNGYLNVTRTIDDDGLRQPVTVRSSYRRVSDMPRWNIEAGNGPGMVTGGPATAGFFVQDGTRFVAVLDRSMTTANLRDGDLYSMTARSPAEYAGAVIQGSISALDESGRANGEAGMTLNIQSIRLRNGREYQFDGMIEDVRTPDGESVRVDRGGAVGSHDSQTEKVVGRSVLGAALGAMIGAVAGGGKGAAIGAVIGAGGGAGTVMIEGRDRLDLPRGTEITFISGNPRNQGTSQREPR